MASKENQKAKTKFKHIGYELTYKDKYILVYTRTIDEWGNSCKREVMFNITEMPKDILVITVDEDDKGFCVDMNMFDCISTQIKELKEKYGK